MKRGGYSLVEVMIAAAVVAIGLSAGAILVGAIVAQKEQDHISLRAANIQEQAIALYRLGISDSATIARLMPEPATNIATPAPGIFSIVFSAEGTTNLGGLVNGDSREITMSIVTNSLIYGRTVPPSGATEYLTNTQTFLLPTIRIR